MATKKGWGARSATVLLLSNVFLCVDGLSVDFLKSGARPLASPEARGLLPRMVATVPTMPAQSEDGEDCPGPTFDKAISQPDPIPEEGRARAMELMESGALFRYSPGFLSETSLAEADMVDYTGFKYSVGFNSCGSALFIGLKVAGVQPGDKVLANAFSFTAVPSAIHHAGAEPVYVESTNGYTMCAEDLRAKLDAAEAEGSPIKFLMLTHMRGKVADMDTIHDLAEERGVTVVEDCAHALGIQWKGVQLGRRASVACYSTQSAKVINSGEGGFFCTDDEEMAARAYCYAGCYEQLYNQHVVSPPAAVFDRVKRQTPNYSLRMSDLAAACVRPQITNIEQRIARYNEMYERITSQIADVPEFDIPPYDERVRPVKDSLQINLQMSDEQVGAFLAATKRRGIPAGLFGSPDNARNFRCWEYALPKTDLPRTERLIKIAIDIRLPATFEPEDFDQMAAVLRAARDDVMLA